MSKFHILSIDGGGIKGIISAIVIEYIEKLIQEYTNKKEAKISDYFNLIAGTSTGAILAGIYLCPNKDKKAKFSASDAVELYNKNGDYIFQRDYYHSIKTINGVIGPKYDNKNLKEVLNRYFGEVKVSQLIKACLITSYDTEKREPTFFNSVSSSKKEDRDYLARDAILSSAAAPTYFPPSLIVSSTSQKGSFIDGGICCNNPAVCAFVEAIKMSDCKSIDEITVLSIGNISNGIAYKYSDISKWGVINWAAPILDIIMDASVQTVDHQLKVIFSTLNKEKHYLRIEIREEFKKHIPALDDAAPLSIKRLHELGNELIKQYDLDLKNYIKNVIIDK